ncbi:MAG: dethiobiotin synthase [Planctomycetota bacterium]|jgi:8-amino-7-oxononanoate synthase
MSDTPGEWFHSELASLEEAGLRRDTRAVTAGVDLTSNDYLGLSADPRLAEAAIRAIEEHGVGAGAARLLARSIPAYESAEQRAAEWLEAEAALLFPTGFQANLGTIASLTDRGDAIFSDRLNHASLIDATRMSRAEVHVHEHLDLGQLDEQLAHAGDARRRLVVTEGVFSMDGDAAPIAELCELCARHDAWLLVDEAHSAGLLGPRGSGAVAAARALGANTDRVIAQILTGGKALGSAGALTVGKRELREVLVNRARSFTFSTAPPPSVAASLTKAIELAADMDDERARCLAGARRLTAELGLPDADAAIVPWPTPGNTNALEAAARFVEAGFGVRAIRWPTVPRGSERLRLVSHAHNRPEELEAFLALAREVRSGGADDSSNDQRQGTPQTPPSPHPTPIAGAGVARAGHRGGASGGTRPEPVFVVAGTDTDVGKTVLSAIALSAARRLGPAGYWKPVQTGSDDDTETVRALTDAPGSDLAEPLRRYPLPASPHEAAADAGDVVPVDELTPTLDALCERDRARRWIVELAGGLLVPIRIDRLQLDWLREIRRPILFAARSALGTLNHTLLSVRAARAEGVEIRALFLIGDVHDSNRETLITLTGIPDVFEIPRFPTLDRRAIDGWLDNARSHRGRSLMDVISSEADGGDPACDT